MMQTINNNYVIRSYVCGEKEVTKRAKFGRLVARFPRAAVTELWCQLIADDLVRPTDHVTYASPTIGR